MRGTLLANRRGIQRFRQIAITAVKSSNIKLLLFCCIALTLVMAATRASDFMGWTNPSDSLNQFLPPGKGYAIVMNTWKRYDLLKQSISHYSSCPGLESIHIVWSEPNPPSDSLSKFLNHVIESKTKGMKKVELSFDINTEDSLNNRFKEIPGLKTDAVFSIDDDVIFPCSSVEFAFKVWQSAPDAMAGFVPRAHWVDKTVNATLQTVVAELQALRHISSQNFTTPELTGNLNCQAEASNTQNSAPSDLNPPNHPISRNLTHPDNPHYHQNLDRNYSTLKLSFPRFNGVDPTGWLYKAEQYFEFQNIHPQQKVHLASFHLEEDALQWHRWLNKFRGHLTWPEFTQAVLHRFGPTDYEDPSEALTRLKQTTTVNIYQTEFEQLSQRIDGPPENYLVGCFVAGLRDDIRLDVKVKQPRTLMDAIGVARLVEERIQLQKRFTPVLQTAEILTHQKNNTSTSVGLLGPPPILSPNQKSEGGFTRITSQEARDRRAKGLCFYCDEKFVRGHRCQRPQLFMIEETSIGGELNFEEDATGENQWRSSRSYPEFILEDKDFSGGKE